jgi:hypothetical protein
VFILDADDEAQSVFLYLHGAREEAHLFAYFWMESFGMFGMDFLLFLLIFLWF